MDEGTAVLHAEAICDLLRLSKKWNAPKLAVYLRRFEEKSFASKGKESEVKP